MHLVGVYLSLIGNKVRLIKEGIWRLLPRRKVTRGRNTTVHTRELGGLQRQRRKIVLQEDEVHIGKKMDKDTDPEAREDEEEREELFKWTKFIRKYTTE